MLSSLLNRNRRDDGFTLIELLVVVIIIGILAAIALPIFIDQSKQAVDASVKSDVRNTVTNVNEWRSVNDAVLPASAEAYATAGGVLATSKGAYVNVAFTADGNYTVCGYNPGGAKYADYQHAWLFDSSTGKFNAGVAECVNALQVLPAPTAGDSTVLTIPSGRGGTSTYLKPDPQAPKVTPPSGGSSSPVTPDPYANDPTQELVVPSAMKFTANHDPDYGVYGFVLDTTLTEVKKSNNPTIRATGNPYLDGKTVGYSRSTRASLHDVTFYRKDGTEYKNARLTCGFLAEYYSKDQLDNFGYSFNNAAYRFVINCDDGRFTDAFGNLIPAQSVSNDLNGGYVTARFVNGNGSLDAPIRMNINANFTNS